MVFKLDFTDDAVRRWSRTENDVICEEDPDYRPTCYVSAETGSSRSAALEYLRSLPTVEHATIEQWRRGFRHDPEPIIRVDAIDIDAVREVARELRGWGEPGEYRCYNVDLSPQFRYCLETDTDPTPQSPLDSVSLDAPPTALTEPPVTEITVDGQLIDGGPQAVVQTVQGRLTTRDPDVLTVSAADLVPLLYATADQVGLEDFELGRKPGYRQLAAESTYESYGRVGHSPARYDIPGRVLINESNTFLLEETNLAGCLDLVSRSWKPLQELAWASIGNVLTAIQIREAMARAVLVPWRSWRHEFFKPATVLNDADRGGFTFAPDVGYHETVHELDFSSLYPNIICSRNVSPETIRCDCHGDREDVPGLGYSICDERGYLVDVLQPLIDDRDAIKAELNDCDEPERREVLQGQSDAIKWILVSCFGYQGFSNAKFGRIECHEAINAFAREILLDAKARLEAAGWRVVHGIVDSLWVTPMVDQEQEPLEQVAAAISEQVGIRLEYEDAFEWIAFVPQRNSDAGALTKYFGKRADPTTEDETFKYRGIEIRQRSTPEFVAAVQRELIETMDQNPDPEAVCDRLQQALQRLESGGVALERLLITNRVSKRLDAYEQHTRNVAALKRGEAAGLDIAPGQSVEYVVVDDSKAGRGRVRLAHELGGEYDAGFYREQLMRVTESVVSPFGWRQSDITRYLTDSRDVDLATFGSSGDGS